ncbi:hypothetical protein HPB47_004335 [Ixodes persulcatus]|uniref:Uncharacterized protein n=1 Tax=Ixodes persulcatus TaxID=34615 RepID=A0AC60PGY1_IXOPE|nr:hypothetical protein HPB47_004335 [Ixodes persulcatus]
MSGNAPTVVNLIPQITQTAKYALQLWRARRRFCAAQFCDLMKKYQQKQLLQARMTLLRQHRPQGSRRQQKRKENLTLDYGAPLLNRCRTKRKIFRLYLSTRLTARITRMIRHLHETPNNGFSTRHDATRVIAAPWRDAQQKQIGLQ